MSSVAVQKLEAHLEKMLAELPRNDAAARQSAYDRFRLSYNASLARRHGELGEAPRVAYDKVLEHAVLNVERRHGETVMIDSGKRGGLELSFSDAGNRTSGHAGGPPTPDPATGSATAPARKPASFSQNRMRGLKTLPRIFCALKDAGHDRESRYLYGLLTGAAFAAIVFFTAVRAGLFGAPGSFAQADAARLEAGIASMQSILDQRVDLLRRISEALDAERAENGAYPATPEGGFSPVAEILPAFAGAAKAVLQPGETPLRLRVVGDGYKLVFTHPTCLYARMLKPALVDPLRDRKKDQCMFYGVWNDAGAGL